MATIPDKVNIGALATILMVGAISMIGISAALTALVRSETEAYGDSVGSHANLRPKGELSRQQEAELTAQPAWSDRAQGRVSLPIERAMELVVEDLRKYPEHATAPAPRDAAAADPDAGAAATGDAGEATEAGAAPEGTEPGATEGTPAEAPQGAAVPEKRTPGEPPAGAGAEREPTPKAPAPKPAPKSAPAPAPEPPAPDPGSE